MDEHHGAIYVPPANGLPYLVVTVTSDGVVARPAQTRAEARILLSRERLARARAGQRGHDGVERTIDAQ